MKKLLTSIIALMLSIACVFTMTACGNNGKDEMINGYDGSVVGVDMYLMALVCEELDMKMNVTDMDFDGIVGAVSTKDNAVGAAGITINDERKLEVDFSNAYFSSVQYIISGKDEAYTSLEDLAGKIIGVQKGTTGALMVTDAINGTEDEDGNHVAGVLEGTGASVLEYDTGAVAFTAMKNGKCNFVVIDELPAKKIVDGQANYVANAVEGVEVEEYGFCVDKDASKNAEILAAMNKVIGDLGLQGIQDVVDYYTSISKDEEPTVTIKKVDLSDNKAGTLEVYTCSGFEPYEFVID